MRASIIIRAYNAEATLARAIESALRQEFPKEDYEVIVVDDGSTDGTKKVVRVFKSVKYIHQKNSGIVKAANVGVEAAKGDLVSLLDADDEFLPDLLAQMTQHFDDGSLDAAYPDYFEEYRGTKKLVSPAHILQVIAGGMVWRRGSLLRAGGFPEGTIFPEYDLLLSTWGKWKLFHVPSALMIYHRREESLTGNNSLIQKSIGKLKQKYPNLTGEIEKIRSYAL
ncbi:hypothetical protein A3A39_02355 [Candidatus Kaiserbacteria bacterium RIFCSPLOWO2_01_FULL_54_13]|uniref:Glycosyltransferase 2-like domain-containing protein n=1 Tax=Candidatus Kaiserbacteria bacterium RIFCSPLOWO2_01_FULL_54_13 TaxID=1798512 RepID=A0A1F6F136_9BACT|nr:MAG: hypothetical protein A3A39_02355 [Candidatus Kaiserbacteria bacterium RIFCSPLOWO2_01_FULL_54_13]